MNQIISDGHSRSSGALWNRGKFDLKNDTTEQYQNTQAVQVQKLKIKIRIQESYLVFIPSFIEGHVKIDSLFTQEVHILTEGFKSSSWESSKLVNGQ